MRTPLEGLVAEWDGDFVTAAYAVQPALLTLCLNVLLSLRQGYI